MARTNTRRRARLAAILIGIGLGGFVDGILLHQLLQWHNMLSSVVPPDTMAAMQVNMRWDGLFHLVVWSCTVAGVFLLWSVTQQGGVVPPTRWFVGMLLLGWGLFNLVEGLIDHQLLGIHHVRYLPPHAWDQPSFAWDMGFLLVGGVGLIALGGFLARAARRA